jgi:hypothetical protein
MVALKFFIDILPAALWPMESIQALNTNEYQRVKAVGVLD